MNTKTCFECGKKFELHNGMPVFQTIDYHGSPVNMHKVCAKRFAENKPVTAQEVGQVVDISIFGLDLQ